LAESDGPLLAATVGGTAELPGAILALADIAFQTIRDALAIAADDVQSTMEELGTGGREFKSRCSDQY
jgi:hypothetical protein